MSSAKDRFESERWHAPLAPSHAWASRSLSKFVSLALFQFCISSFSSSAVDPLHYAIENLDQGGIVRSGQTGPSGIRPGELFLGSETRYRAWFLRPTDLSIGFSEFRTEGVGVPFRIPPVTFRPPLGDDSDGDGLSDEAEMIVGTNPTKADTDGDGVKDGEAIRLGVDSGARRIGVVGGALTEGPALDVCAINNIAIVANGDSGITVFNVFERLTPVRIAQVDTPGRAQAVTCSGNLIAVADGTAGVSVIDISDPPASGIKRTIPIGALGGGNAQAITSVGDVAFAGTDSGWVSAIDLKEGIVLERLSLGGRIEDLTTESDRLYAYAAGKLQIISVLSTNLSVIGAANASGSPALERGRLFVGGGLAYLVNQSGYNLYSVTNPSAPQLIRSVGTAQRSWKHIAVASPGLGLAAVGADPSLANNRDVWIYDVSDPTADPVPRSNFPTPGFVRSLSIFNSLVYIAASDAGLQVANYAELDLAQQPPTGFLTSSVTGSATNGAVIEGSRIVFTARVQDDRQIRNVEFFVDGQRMLVDGSFPFEFGWRAPAIINANPSALALISAVAYDTGGNRTNLNSIQIQILPDTDGPKIAIQQPEPETALIAGDMIGIRIGLFDSIGADPNSVRFFINGAQVGAYRTSLSDWFIEAPYVRGSYELVVQARDYAGNEGISSGRTFRVREEASSREFSAFNLGSETMNDVISKEFSLFNLGPDDDDSDAISREWSAFNLGPIEALDSISREVSVENRNP